MLPLIAVFAIAQFTDLERVGAAVSRLPGVRLQAEMAATGVRIVFRMAPGGHAVVEYPTTTVYLRSNESVTWFNDRREFFREKAPDENPLPIGFGSLWTRASTIRQNAAHKSARFNGKDAVEIPCLAPEGYPVSLFVNPSNWIPLGSIAVANGKTYEFRYLSVNPTTFRKGELDFKPPKDARPFSSPQDADRLIKPGTTLTKFAGKDTSGKPIDAASLAKEYPAGLVLNFWFASCTGCVAEMPFLTRLAPRLRKAGIGIIGVNPIDDIEAAKRCEKRQSLSYPSLVGKGASDLKAQVGVVAYPVTVVLDSKGVVVDSMISFDEKRLATAIGKLGFNP